MFRLLYSGKQDENTNLVEEYQAQQGNTAVAAPVDQQKQGTRKTEPTTPTEPADNPSGGLSAEVLMYLIGGAVSVLALVIFFILRVRSIRKNRIPTDDFDDDDDDEDITGNSGEYEIK